MSKPVKALLRKELARRLKGVESLVVFSLAGVGGVATNQLRRSLREKHVSVMVVKNSVAKQALKEVGLESASVLLEGPCAFATGGESTVMIVKELLAHVRDVSALQLRGAVLEGEIFGAERMAELGRYPTREQALANVAMLATSAGPRLVGALSGPGASIAGVLKAIEQAGQEPQAA